jgi:hypothetical protein
MSNTLRTDEDHRIDRIEDWVAGDSRRIRFTVTQDGSPRDISNDTLEWRLSRRPYQRTDTELSDGDPGVEIISGSVFDPETGVFEVRIDSGVTSDIWGELYQTVVVDAAEDTRQSWLGEVWLESA